MDLARDNDRLKMDTISADLTLSADGNRYLLVLLDSQSKAVVLNSVTALAERREPESTRIELDAQANKISDEEAVWRWARPQPLTSLRISMASEGVLPVALSWRSGEKAWQPLTKTVLYRLDGKRSEDIQLSGQPVEAVRITTINARLPTSLPAISGARDKYQLIFNTQGKGPYMLAWGNRAAPKADVAMDMLIPASLRKTQAVSDLPLAVAQESVTLGGEARLTATSATEQQSGWKTLLVWGALIVGVLVLALMAWRIWREVKKAAPYKTKRLASASLLPNVRRLQAGYVLGQVFSDAFRRSGHTFFPFSHCAGQTSPCSSWNCSASTIRSISSMLRPSGRSLTTW